MGIANLGVAGLVLWASRVCLQSNATGLEDRISY